MRERKLETRPPAPTGDAARDAAALAQYLEAQRDELNYILTLLYRRLGEKGENNGE